MTASLSTTVPRAAEGHEGVERAAAQLDRAAVDQELAQTSIESIVRVVFSFNLATRTQLTGAVVGGLGIALTEETVANAVYHATGKRISSVADHARQAAVI